MIYVKISDFWIPANNFLTNREDSYIHFPGGTDNGLQVVQIITEHQMSDNSPHGHLAPYNSHLNSRQLAPDLTLCQLVEKSAFYRMQC